jgi:hypothetical protein
MTKLISSFEYNVASILAGFGIPALTCTPDMFPDLIANAIQHRDLN